MKGVFMSQEDVLDRLRTLDPDLRFDDADEAYEAQALMHQVLSRPRTQRRRLRLPSVPRVAAIAAAAVGVVLVLPALAVGTSPFGLLAQQDDPATPVNGLLVAKGDGALYVVDPKSGGMLRLKDTADMDHPAWSPDGRMLAVDRTEKGSTNVYTMWPNGTHARLIMKDASSPAWSDDGTRIFVQRDLCTTPGGCDSSDDDTIVVYSVAANGTDDARQVEEGDYDVSQPGWPPGQNVLAFLGNDGSNDARTGPAEVNSLDATWSPDGTELAVADTPTGLWLIDGDGTPRLVAKGAFSSLSWGVEAATPPAAGSAQR
jgi:dipeptidyl aminopeptidase/acylaminoacyl peptidase